MNKALLNKRIFCGALTLTAVMAVPIASAAYPDQPIHFVVPYSAGGSTDLLARMLGEKVGNQLGQTVIVENRPGAGSNIGTGYVAKSEPDGYTILMATSTALATNPHLFKNLQYDPQKDLAPIILTSTLPSMVVVNDKLPVKTIAELNTYLKGPDGPHTFASAGTGTPAHLGGELYKRSLGVNVIHVPYKGGAPALTDLVGGQTDFMIAVAPEAIPLVKDGRLRALAVTTKTRLAAYPDLPTVAESGIPGYELIAWYGVLAPAGTPAPIIDKLNAAFDKALQDPAVAKKMGEMGFVIDGGTPSVLTERIRTESAKMKELIEQANITLD
ncbi:Bug family tripartite tricarboxylate transporter substrate binding protein [Bordetella tumulicola]|uniref:Bug family tripartite tricarboxylate transporter substrate binding protein n=1 Tax=Bordetella tumulicola TaxID=1649133 RepID=UPI0039F005F0